LELWELEATEAIRRTITAYNFGTDRGAFEEVADCFTENGVLEVATGERAQGRPAIVAMLQGVAPHANSADAEGAATTAHYVHHHVTNIHLRSLTDHDADVSSYFLVLTAVGVDHWGRYRDRLVRAEDGQWRFEHRLAVVDGHARESRFVRDGDASD
jgi:ketosteroid isomerase-like protein